MESDRWPFFLRSGVSGTGLAVALVVAAYVGLATAYNVVNPLFEAPDEIWHYLYVRHVALGQGLPLQDWSYSDPLAQQEAAQPPLYYVVAGVATALTPHGDLGSITKPNPSASIGEPTSDGNKNRFIHGPDQSFPWPGEVLSVHVARATSTGWGALAVLLVALTALALRLPALVVVASTATVAFTPQFLYLGSAVSNDAATAALGALLLCLTVRQAHRPLIWRRSLLLGIVAGAAILAKPLLIVGIGLVFLALAMATMANARSSRAFVAHAGIASASVAVIAGWWFVRNVILYGSLAPLNRFLNRQEVTIAPPTLRDVLAPFPTLFRSYWALFGWFSILAPPWYYILFGALTLAAAIGSVILVARLAAGLVKARRRSNLDLRGITITTAWAVLVVLSLEAWLVVVPAFQGRLAFGGISAFGLLLAIGWSGLAGRRIGPVLSLVCSLSLCVPAVLAPSQMLAQAYAPPPTVDASQIPPGDRRDLRLGPDILLRGASVKPDPRSLRPGESVRITLYLQGQRALSEDYFLFLQILDWRGQAVAKVDSYPGRGALPTSLWVPGQIIADSYRLTVPPDLPVPSIGDLIVGMYRRDTMTRLSIVDIDGKPLGNFVSLGPVVFREPSAGGPSTAGVSFAGRLALVDWRLPSATVAAGGVLRGELDYVDLQPLERDLTIYVHLVGSAGLVAQDDSLPVGGAFPTKFWQPGDQIHHPFNICVPVQLRPGPYRLVTGFYDPRTMERLPVPNGDEVFLATINVTDSGSPSPSC